MPNSFKGSLPLFIFIDPFGATGVGFSNVVEILEAPCSEVLLNLDADGIDRIYQDLNSIKHSELMDEIFGEGLWEGKLSTTATPSQRYRQVLDLYIDNLKLKTNVRYAFAFEMRKSDDKLDYFLIFLSHHPLGLRKMKEVMKTIDKTGEYHFSDATVGQMKMFRFDNPEDYAPKLFQAFVGQEVSYSDVDDYALNKTPFTDPKGMLVVLEKENRITVKSLSGKRPKHTFNPDKIDKILFMEGDQQWLQLHPIEWTQMTWNPVRGCTRVSEGCRNCYAERLATRFTGIGQAYEGLAVMTPSGPRWTNKVRLVEDVLEQPLRWRQPRLIFVNSMSDLFHPDVPLDFIQRVFDVIERCPRHTFQMLTKRSERLRQLAPELKWPANAWMGVSVEDARVTHRVNDLQNVPAAVRFLSVEPLIGPIDALPLEGIHWVIVGGESGPGARPIEPEWVDSIFEQCRAAEAAFFFKQWGGPRKHRTGRELHGRTYSEMPVQAQVRLPRELVTL